MATNRRDPSTNGATAGPLLAPPSESTSDSEECHLAPDRCAATLTRIELAFMRVQEAFASWVVELHKHAHGPQLSFQDVALVHCVRLRGGTPTMGDMLIFQHRHDLSSLQYGFKKLESLKLLRKVKGASRREVAYELTAFGLEVTDRYAQMRHQMLVGLCADVVGMDQAMNDAAAVIERLIGLYDQATQSVLNEHILKRDTLYVSAAASKSSPGAAQPDRARSPNSTSSRRSR